MDTLSSRPPVWFPEPGRLRPFRGEFVCPPSCRRWSQRFPAASQLAGLSRPACPATCSWPALSLAPLCAAGQSQSGSQGSGQRSCLLEVTSKWRDGLVCRCLAPSALFPLYLLCLGWFRHHPAESVGSAQLSRFWRPPCDSLLSLQRPVVGAAVSHPELIAVAVLVPTTDG